MESFKQNENNGRTNDVLVETCLISGITAILMTAGTISMYKKDEKEVPKVDQSQIHSFFEKPADRKITKSIILLRNAVDYGSLQSSLLDYDKMIKSLPENESKSLTNGEYLAIQARAIEIAQKKGIKVGDVLSVPVENWDGPSEINYIGNIDIGENITQNVVPPVFNKIYVKMSEDGKTLDFLQDKVEVIKVSDDDEVLTPEEKTIRLSVK